MEEKDKTLKSEVALKEEAILDFWDKNEIFKKTLDKESPKGLPAQTGNFVFFDGPPFATGLPHYGHILPGTIKDVIPRYQTMRGLKVSRRWGWDCHGLPVENIIEKELSLGSKKDIETYGVEKFNKYARDIVFRYADEWKKIIPRSGRWVDMENDYRTMDPTYTESVWWAFKNLYDKGLVYQGFKSMLLCPRCETTLSNFEVNQGYKDITDISVTVKFELTESPKKYILAWTTTPWTLPGNVGLAVNPEMEYVEVQGAEPDSTYILAKTRVEAVFGKEYKIIRNVDPKDIVGKSYKPIFEYYNKDTTENKENGWKIYSGKFVTAEEGTGVVHIAPAFGEDDMNLGKENNLPFIQHVNRDGTFKSEVTDFAGMKVKPIDDHQKTDIEIIKHLAKQGVLFSKTKIIHSYPHCWRCSTPLLNYATTSWFIKVTTMKERLVELNKTISWTPEDMGEGRFGKWLEGARDWAISRSRYWGAPLPVWQKESGEKIIVGSIADLKKYIGLRNGIFLMRHGQSERNVKKLISSKKEIKDPLTLEGINESVTAAKELKKEKIDIIFSSPFSRAKETAVIVAKEIGMDEKEIIYDDRLVEISTEGYEDKSWSDFDLRKNIEGIESLDEIRKRVMQLIYEIDKKYEGKNILIIGHGGPLNAMRLGGEGFAYKDIAKHFYENPLKNAEVIKIDFVSLPHNETYEIDLHKPYIDEVVLRDTDGSVLKRVPEVFDCWLESGSMSFAQYHYPFENKEEFEKVNSSLFSADFIAEGLDQTRGWFYTLLVLSVGLFDKVPYKHVVVNGLVLAEDGRKMSKSLNNYPDLMDVINRYGADALRYYLISSPLVKAEDFNFKESGVDEVYKKLIQKIYNVLTFYEMYPVLQDGKPKESILDTWILARLNELTETITLSLDKYELDRASRPILEFVDDLSTWYIRRSRERFKSENVETRMSVSYYTAYVLREFSKVIAPFVPFLAEEIYGRTGGEKESVHLEEWPMLKTIDRGIVDDMKKVRLVVTEALELRQKAGHKVRQPLTSLTIPSTFSSELLDIIAEEVNVKNVFVSENSEIKLDTILTADLQNEGVARDIIRAIQDARKTENLSPDEKVKLVVYTSPNIKSIIEVFDVMIKSPTQVTEIIYSTDPQTYVVPLSLDNFSLSIIK
jgi:isoleucyl-tRNA synthetase